MFLAIASPGAQKVDYGRTPVLRARISMSANQEAHEVPVVLIIGDVDAGAEVATLAPVRLPYHLLTAQAISTIFPQLIILQLFGPGFDAMEALQRVERLGYRGAVLVQGPHLPNRAIVERELAAIVPALNVRLTGPAA
jgi:hypothetical protein